jgi:hypothetical protein
MVSLMLVLLAVVPEWDLVTSNTFVRGVCSDGQAVSGAPPPAESSGSGTVRGSWKPTGIRITFPTPEPGYRSGFGGKALGRHREGLVLIEEGETTVFTSFEGIPGTGSPTP